MTRRKLLLILVVVAIAAAFGYVRFASHDAPAGQLPLAYLDPASLATVKADFNRAASETRIIVLLSPT
ncbi:MAG: hypothetical protein A3H96_13925 [Acidobacteria bacterium RIFCSPLOWO2_02_FULL_67_36]|nr:MAG: hypothetical protein A3H96_13925 [Acidobacteria bacterium RIFCSPLOWO2_02_FULL_67_36]OFW18328.1 MAG: hypothetical protein A3G21_07435 [Acidobacteria bacterium RIFCSPLOWO2_12_FULL_66_21]